ncbi:MAG TPA: hypothetical protein VK851_10720 [Anaerolineales bacterium]|nr:hypothetical protein [Anaerolineales bacterium]
MDTITIIAYALILYGIIAIALAYFKPRSIWKIGKIQGFVQLLGEKGTVIFFDLIGVLTIAGGIYLLFR